MGQYSETLSPRLTTYILKRLTNDTRVMKTKCHHLTSLIRLWVAGAEWCFLMPYFSTTLSLAFSVRKMLLNSVIEMNFLANDWPNHRKRVNQMPTWFIVIRQNLSFGMEKKVSFLIQLEGPTNHRGWSVGGSIMGAGKLSRSIVPQSLLFWASPKDLATKYFDEFQVETNVLKRNDIWLV